MLQEHYSSGVSGEEGNKSYGDHFDGELSPG